MYIESSVKRKIKIALPVLVLITTFLFFIYNMINSKYIKKEAFRSLNNQIVLLTKLSKIIHETQKERGLSVGYLSNHSIQFHKLLLKQYAQTDMVVKELRRYILQEKLCSCKVVDTTLKRLDTIELLRKRVKELSISALEIRNDYTAIDNNILQTVIEISKHSKEKKISNEITAYTNLLFYEENLGLERAVGTNILSKKVLTQELINLFNSYIIKGSVYENLFLSYASDKSKNYYYSIYNKKVATKIAYIQKSILNANLNEVTHIDPQEWFEEMTLFINTLKRSDDYLSLDMLEKTANSYTLSQEEYFQYIVFGILIFILFIMMIVMILDMQKSEARLKNLIDSYIISSTTDLKGVIQSVSHAFCNISGYKEDELIGKPHNIVRHRDNPSIVFEDMWSKLKLNQTWQGEIKNLKKDGGYYWVTAVVSPIFHKGKKIGYNSIRQDITDSKKIAELNRSLKDKIEEEVAKSRQKDQQMIQQSRLAQMGEMISMIAHQWRQPLTAISATSSTLYYMAKRDQLDPEFVLEKTEKINSYSQHLSDTINDFRDFFKRDKITKETNIDRLVTDVLKIIELSLKSQNIHLKLSLKAPSYFKSYPNEIKQVILNILKNAEDTIVEKAVVSGLISIKSYETKESVILEIEDNGGGIDSDIIENIFDPYFSTKLKKDGTGLGLYMSKTIIEEHCAGNLSVKSFNGYTLFTIKLQKKS